MPSSQGWRASWLRKLPHKPSEVIVELGPGTGVFTRELLARGVEPANLILVEFNKEFVKFLKHEFPQLRVVEGRAQDLPQLLKALGQDSVRKIISGIPLRSMKPVDCRHIAKSVAAVLEPGGAFVQFSYFKASPCAEIGCGGSGIGGRLCRLGHEQCAAGLCLAIHQVQLRLLALNLAGPYSLYLQGEAVSWQNG